MASTAVESLTLLPLMFSAVALALIARLDPQSGAI
jgi:hypothetical protein